MTDRRPPKDAAHDTDSDGSDEAPGHSEGKRSQTLPAGASDARAARSAFQPASPPADSDKTVKRAYPNAWGATVLVGNAVPPPDGARPMTDTEKTVVSELPPPASAARAEPVRSAPPHAGAEPLREPSNRPVPTPFQQSQKARAAVSGTLLMPGVSADDFAAARAPKAAPAARANPPSASAARAQHAPPPTPPSNDVAQRAPNRTEPLHLSLDARDMVPKATTSVRPDIPRSRAPLMVLIAGIGVLMLIAALAWFRHAAPAAEASAPTPIAGDGLRSSAVPAAPATAPVAPAATVAPATTALPATPSAPAARPATPVAAQKPAAAAVSEQHAQPAADHRAEKKPAAAASKPAAHQAAPAKAHSTASKAPSENSAGIEDAREALKALESPPVVSVKRKADIDEPAAPAGDEGAPPPPLPDPEGE